MRKVQCLGLPIVIGGLSIIAAAGHAQVIVSNLSQTPIGVDGAVIAAAQEFTTGPTALSLGDVILPLIGTPADTLTVTLNADTGTGIPGVALDSLGTATPLSTTLYSDITLLPATPLTLAANTNYWIVGNYNGVGDWGYALNYAGVTGVGSLGELNSFQSGWQGPFTSEPYIMQVDALASTSVAGTPEPGALALLTACGICGTSFIRRRRVK